MDPILIGVAIFTVAVSVHGAFQRGDDGPNWELRWRGLDPGHPDWLAAMTTSRAWSKTLSDPEDLELARGFARHEQRRLASLDLIGAILVAFGVVLALAGIAPTSVVALGLLAATSIRSLAELLRRRRIKAKLPERSDPDAVPTR